MNPTQTHTNRLIHATSPYLLQHAHNPVDWYEWGEEALAKARREDKPILVSIGYSSCHWCHVMERESFENEDIAQIMNEFFVCIKVDREERPDIDQIYMEAVQAMGIHGGWPLNVFLTPEQKPFYGGTYFPTPSWAQVLNGLHKAYGLRRSEVEASAEELKEALSRSDLDRFKQAAVPGVDLFNDLEAIYAKLEPQFDTSWGGMSKAPKFVMPSTWLLLLRHYHLTSNERALRQIIITLRRIAMGGIHDQAGGGFARYSVDAYWFVPHFEKMLYDNAQLMSLYAEAYAATGDDEFREVVKGIFTWLRDEMTHTDGGFYSALDADSEGVEGKFYVWTQQEFNDVLGTDAAQLREYYAIEEQGNWEHSYNILKRNKSNAQFLQEHGIKADEWQAKLSAAHAKLLEARNKRVRPGLDDKIITAWNALMITGLTDAYRALGDEAFLEAATRNMAFIENNLMEGDLLFRSYKNKRSTTTGFHDDYAFMIQAYISLYEVTFHEAYIKKAADMALYTLEHFYDTKDGFFFYTSHTSESLIARKKEIFDNVIPGSNSVMARNLLRLGVIFDRADWQKLGKEMISSLSHLIRSEPNYMANWGIGLLELKRSPAEVVFSGVKAKSLRKEFHEHYHPFAITMGYQAGTALPLVKDKAPSRDETTIFVCFNRMCKLPVHTVPEAEAQLRDGREMLN